MAGDVAAALRELIASGEIWGHTWISLQRVLGGFALGLGAGLALGVAMGLSPLLKDDVYPSYMNNTKRIALKTLVALSLAATGLAQAQIAEVPKKVAEREGLRLLIVEFAYYIQPNAALDAGDVQTNSFQHPPFLPSQIQARGYKFSAIGNIVTAPMGFYSKTYKSLADLPRGAKVGIQNDPSNSGRG